MALCPCGSEKTYEDCCALLHQKKAIAETPGEVMRARYSAFVTGNIEYLMDSIPEDKQETIDEESLVSWSKEADWDRLKVVQEVVNGDRGEVEFIAYYHRNKIEFKHHEHAYFEKIEGVWYYSDGRMLPETGQKERKEKKIKKVQKLILSGKKRKKKR